MATRVAQLAALATSAPDPSAAVPLIAPVAKVRGLRKTFEQRVVLDSLESRDRSGRVGCAPRPERFG